MFSRLFNGILVLLGLELAGVTSVGADTVRNDPPPVATASEFATAQKSSSKKKNGRIASGTRETCLHRVENPALLADTFSFADDVVAETIEPAGTIFVMRPLPSLTQRPVARLEAVKARSVTRKKTGGAARQMPGQVKQANRPASRAALRADGKKSAKRIVWMQPRLETVASTHNVIAFPTPAVAGTAALKRAA